MLIIACYKLEGQMKLLRYTLVLCSLSACGSITFLQKTLTSQEANSIL